MGAKPRSLSGIKPTGTTHLGNYLGMIKPAIQLQETHETFYFIADYHALTSIREPESLKEHSYDLTATFASLGMDFEEHAFFRQSDIPEVTELTWFMACLTSKGLMERAHAFKDAQSKGQDVNMGLFSYPILMAADILIYDSHVVPVGKDQKQHLEITRDIAIRFNHTYGETLVIPEPDIEKTTQLLPGIDGQKMSKSYQNTIPIFAHEKVIRKRVMSIVTDNTPIDQPKNKNTPLFHLLSLFLHETEQKDLKERYDGSGLRYGDIKLQLYERIMDYFSPFRSKRDQLVGNEKHVKDILHFGAEKASKVAETVLDRVRSAAGIGYF